MKEKRVFIAVALDCIEAISSYVEGYTADEFLSDRKTQDAVIRNLEVIGQALKENTLAADLWHAQRPGT